jgi:hypothetical protein
VRASAKTDGPQSSAMHGDVTRMLATRSTVTLLREQRLARQDSSPDPIQPRAMAHLSSLLWFSAIRFTRVCDPKRTCRLSNARVLFDEPSALFSGRINISRSVSLRVRLTSLALSPFHVDKRVRLNTAKDAAASATPADAVVEEVVLLTYVAVERRLT